MALKQEAGIGVRKRKDISFDKAADESNGPRRTTGRRVFRTTAASRSVERKLFSGKMQSQIRPFKVEKHKQARIGEDAKVAANREISEISCVRNVFGRSMEWANRGPDPPSNRKETQTGRLTKEPLTRL